MMAWCEREDDEEVDYTLVRKLWSQLNKAFFKWDGFTSNGTLVEDLVPQIVISIVFIYNDDFGKAICTISHSHVLSQVFLKEET